MFNEAQKEAIEWYKGPCLVLGTPGSGKTTVIINRIKYLITKKNVEPSKILVITFTRAAALSMEKRFGYLMEKSEEKYRNAAKKVRFGTFHSIFYWIIRTAYSLSNDAVIGEDEKRNILKKLIQNTGIDSDTTEDTINSVINQMGLISCDMIDINNYYSSDMAEGDFRNLVSRYSDYKRKLGKLDFDDMNTMCYQLLKERPDILKAIKNLYPFIMVDEFQDTNRIQYEILKQLTMPENNIFAVGDDDQSIYGFRGARPEIMLGFPKEFEGTKMITLALNYRCPEVVTTNSDMVIKKNKKRFNKNLASAGRKGDIIVEFPKDVKNENEMIISRVREAHDNGTSYNDIAVLYRTNMNPRRLIYKLREYNIPFMVNDAIPNIFQNFAVSAILDYIRFALGENKRELFVRFMNKPVRYIPRNILQEDLVDITTLIKRAEAKDYLHANLMILRNQLARIKTLTPFAAINYIRKTVGFDEYINEFTKERNMDTGEIMDILDEFMSMAVDQNSFAEFFDFIEDYKRILEEQKDKKNNDDSKEKIALMTMHSSKGLEFKDVHIIDCVEEIIPHKRSKTESALEEERRMFYVAMTRTMEHLYIYAPRKIGEKVRRPSRFITEQTKKETR